MAQAPLRKCSHIGCTQLIRGTRCEQHKREATKRESKPRPSAAKRGYGKRWQATAKGYLMKHPLCAECKSNGRVRAATCVDHIEPHRGDKQKFWERDNWQGLCASCHSKKTRRGE